MGIYPRHPKGWKEKKLKLAPKFEPTHPFVGISEDARAANGYVCRYNVDGRGR